MNVSVLLLTYNEERNLPACLAALAWCDDIVVIDSGSSDRTIELATAAGARVLHNPFKDFADQRNWGLANGKFRHEWVLHLDADEIVTPEFLAAIAALQPTPGIDAYYVPSKIMLFGHWLRHAGMYPAYQVRLGHADRLRFVQIGHGQREAIPPERVGKLDVPYLHFCFSHGMIAWFAKHVRYAKDEAEHIIAVRNGTHKAERTGGGTARRRAAKDAVARLPVLLRPLMRFIYVYFLRQGFRDGMAGLAFAFMLSIYEGMTAVFVLEAGLPGSAIPTDKLTGSTAQ